MLRPHDREDAELDEVGLATERLQDAPIFLVAEAVLGDRFGGDAGGVEYVHARVISGGAGWGLGWNEAPPFHRIARMGRGTIERRFNGGGVFRRPQNPSTTAFGSGPPPHRFAIGRSAQMSCLRNFSAEKMNTCGRPSI